MRSHLHTRLLAVLLLLPAVAWATPIPYQSCFDAASRLHNVPVDLLLAVAATESGWDPDARSDKNAHGIMQIQWPGTARHLGVRRVSELYNPCLNIELGARYLRELIDASNGDVDRALASYNYGPTRISNSVELPAGAIRYIDTVEKHQARIDANVRKVSAVPADGSRAAIRMAGTSTTRRHGNALSEEDGVVFDSRTRAERFADLLNRRIDGASFSTSPNARGGHLVAMSVAASGLTTTDLATLNALGWTHTGASP